MILDCGVSRLKHGSHLGVNVITNGMVQLVLVVSACCLQDVVRVCISEEPTMTCLGHNYAAVR